MFTYFSDVDIYILYKFRIREFKNKARSFLFFEDS